LSDNWRDSGKGDAGQGYAPTESGDGEAIWCLHSVARWVVL